MRAKKICIIGCSGSGKTTLSNQLSQKLGIDVIYLDANFWQEGWVEKDPQTWANEHLSFCEKAEWIIDGTYMQTLETRLKRADAVIFLDLGTGICLRRILQRTLSSYGETRPHMAVGCPERFTFEFFWFVFRYRKNHRPRIIEKLSQLKGRQIYHLRSPKEVSDFLVAV